MHCPMILVISEDDVTLDRFRQVLEKDVQIISISQGQEAASIIQTHPIRVVLVDQQLADGQGLEWLRTLRVAFPSVPMVFMARNPSPDLVIEAFRLGAADFLVQPIVTDELLRSLNRLSITRDLVVQEDSLPRSARRRSAREWIAGLIESIKGAGRYLSGDRSPSRAGSSNGVGELPPNPAPPRLRGHFLGGFYVDLNDRRLSHWAGKKGKEVFSYLVFHHSRRIYRDVLMDRFWPDSGRRCARNSLNVAIHRIRRQLHKLDPHHEYVLYKDECYLINPRVDVLVDVDQFWNGWQAAQQLERSKGLPAAIEQYELAAAHYTGDFMDEELYCDWISQERDKLREIYLVIIDKLSFHYAATGKLAAAISLCRTVLEKDNCREDIHCRLMECYYRQGFRDRALKQFQLCSRILQQELEVEPTQATWNLYNKIKNDRM